MANSVPTVLVVDDDHDIRDLVSLMLTDEGYVVQVAANGRDALAVLADWRPDVIVLDLMMPVMDGPAFLVNRREHPELSSIPVIAMSASKRLESGPAGLGVTAVIAKPFDLDTFLARVAVLTATPTTQTTTKELVPAP